MDPVVAESFAALRAAEFSRNRGLQRIILEGDSLIVVQAINKPGLTWKLHGQLVADIKEVLWCFHFWKVIHTRQGEMGQHMC
jgi:ribonuclease HI